MERFSRILQFNDRVYSKMKDVILFNNKKVFLYTCQKRF